MYRLRFRIDFVIYKLKLSLRTLLHRYRNVPNGVLERVTSFIQLNIMNIIILLQIGQS